MKTHHSKEPSDLYTLWSEIEGFDQPKDRERQLPNNHDRLMHLIHRRIAALLAYARGACQKKAVQEKLSAMGSLATKQIAELGNPRHPEQLIDEWVIDNGDEDPQLISILTSLENAFQSSGNTTKHRLRDLLAQRGKIAA